MNYKIKIKNFISSKFLYFYKLVIFHFFSYLHLFLYLFFSRTLTNFLLFVEIKDLKYFLLKFLSYLKNSSM